MHSSCTALVTWPGFQRGIGRFLVQRGRAGKGCLELPPSCLPNCDIDGSEGVQGAGI